MVYCKERRGAHLGKLMLCPFKLHVTKHLRFLFKKKQLKLVLISVVDPYGIDKMNNETISSLFTIKLVITVN